jgi:ferredoxin
VPSCDRLLRKLCQVKRWDHEAVKVFVDSKKCSGHGRCYTVAICVYSPDDEGYNAARGAEVTVEPGFEEDAMRGASSCPERAIQIMQ